jgi:choline dehydrogenase-like flavoprotein
MCYVRGQIRDFTAWQDAVGDIGKWSYEDLLPVFVAQADNDTFRDEFHGIDGGLAVQLPNCLGLLPERTVTTGPSISLFAKPACRTRQRHPRNSSKRRAPTCAAA